MVPQVQSGIKNLRLVKTAQTTFVGFRRDEYTTLQNCYEKVLRWECFAANTYSMINGHCCILAQTWAVHGCTRMMWLILITIEYGTALKVASLKAGVEMRSREFYQVAFSLLFKLQREAFSTRSRKSAQLKFICRIYFMLISIWRNSQMSQLSKDTGSSMCRLNTHME